jgi:uncharacterized protein YycO
MDVVYCRRHNLGSLALRTLTWSSWSHCGIITPDNTVIEARAFEGVVERPLHELLEESSKYVFRTIDVPDDEAVIAFARSQVGKPYDYFGVAGIAFHRQWQDEDRWFCSELLEAAAAAGGRRRFIVDAWRITQQMSYITL